MELVIGVAGVLLTLAGLVLQVLKGRRRTGGDDPSRRAGLRLINATTHCIAALQETYDLKPRFPALPPNRRMLDALDRSRAYLVEATAARAQLRATASPAVGDAADELLQRLLEAEELVQMPKGRANWDDLWAAVRGSLRTFERTAGLASR